MDPDLSLCPLIFHCSRSAEPIVRSKIPGRFGLHSLQTHCLRGSRMWDDFPPSLKRQWPQLSELLHHGIPLQCLIGQLPTRLLSLLSAHEQPFKQHQSWSSSCWNILYFRMSGCSNGFNRLSAFCWEKPLSQQKEKQVIFPVMWPWNLNWYFLQYIMTCTRMPTLLVADHHKSPYDIQCHWHDKAQTDKSRLLWNHWSLLFPKNNCVNNCASDLMVVYCNYTEKW